MMRNAFFLFVLLSCCIIVLTNCSKEDALVSLSFNETKCADPWRTNEGDSEEALKAAVTDYLENELKIDFDNYQMTFDEEKVQFCEACGCTTGRVITIAVEESAVAELEEVGFTVE
ncbi:MAG: hypothetical protein AAGJ18_23415 [Bacteroidota bacterium]